MSAQLDSLSHCVGRDGIRKGAIVDGRYRIVGTLGSGGMGEVFEAEHLELGALVALKVLRGAADERANLQLLREARLTAGLITDHVVRVSDCGVLANGAPYVVMERLRGEDLRQLLAREGQLSVQGALRIVLQVCAGLTDLHAVGIVHRDLKPANVFVLSNKRTTCRCKLLDLGIARHAAGDTSRSGTISGSVRYMAPEQLTDGKSAAPHTDVYAAGVILYQCLTGVLPHNGETMEEIMFSILNRQPRPSSELRAELSPQLAALVSRAIARDPAKRPGSAAEFAEELSAFLIQPARAEQRVSAFDSTQSDIEPLPVPVAAGPVGLWHLNWAAILAASVLFASLFELVTHFVAAAGPPRSPPAASASLGSLASPSSPKNDQGPVVAARPTEPVDRPPEPTAQLSADHRTQKLDIVSRTSPPPLRMKPTTTDLGLTGMYGTGKLPLIGKNPYVR